MMRSENAFVCLFLVPYLSFHGFIVRADGLTLLGLGLSRQGSVIHNHVVRAFDDANISGNLKNKKKKTRKPETGSRVFSRTSGT